MAMGRVFGILRETGATGAGVTGTITEVEMTAAGILEPPDRMEGAVRETRGRIRVSGTTGPVKEQARAREECTGMAKTITGTAAALGAAEKNKKRHPN